MQVKQLKKILDDYPDDMRVFVVGSFGIFMTPGADHEYVQRSDKECPIPCSPDDPEAETVLVIGVGT